MPKQLKWPNSYKFGYFNENQGNGISLLKQKNPKIRKPRHQLAGFPFELVLLIYLIGSCLGSRQRHPVLLQF